MAYMVAIDSGGTKTDSVLFDESGHILYRDLEKGCNGMDIGKELACERMASVLDRIYKQSGDKSIRSIYGGIAGTMPMGDFLYQYLRPKLDPEVSLRIDDDGCSMISAALGHRNGCGMVCGTGSSLFIRVEGKPLAKVGGKGYLIDTGGSGFELGREAICMAFRACDGRCKPTVLVELLSEAMGKHVKDSMPDIYHLQTGGRSYIASFAYTVFQGRRMGDWACEEIFDRGSSLLADLTYAAQSHFEEEFPVAMGGGLFSAFPEYAEAVKEKAAPRARMIPLETPPVYGAAVEAMWDAGLTETREFRERFLREYAEWTEIIKNIKDNKL